VRWTAEIVQLHFQQKLLIDGIERFGDIRQRKGRNIVRGALSE